MSIAISELKLIVEATLLAAGEPLSLERLLGLFGEDDDHQPSRQELREALLELAGGIATVTPLPNGELGADAPPLVNGLTRDPEQPRDLLGRECAP